MNFHHVWQKLCSILALSILSLVFFPSPIYAQTAPQNAITVSPSIVQLDLANDLPEALLTYTNETSSVVTIDLAANNLTSLEEGYKINYLNNAAQSTKPFELSNWMSFSRNIITIQPHSSTKVFVLINKNQLTPGGHYGAVMGNIEANTSTQGIAIKGSLISLIFVRTNTGKEIEKANLAFLNLNNTWSDFPTTARFQLVNTGNVDVTPYGLLQVNDMFHHQIVKNIINQDSLLTLPQSSRDYQINLNPNTTKLWPGVYTAQLSLHYGKTNQKIIQSITFLYLANYPLYAGTCILAIIILVILIRIIYSRFLRK